MDNVILIQFEDRYEDIVSTIGIAQSIDVAERYTAALATAYPDAYGDNVGMFIYTPFEMITENDIP